MLLGCKRVSPLSFLNFYELIPSFAIALSPPKGLDGDSAEQKSYLPTTLRSSPGPFTIIHCRLLQPLLA